MHISNQDNLITINGVKKTNGLTTLKIKIFEIEKSVNVYVIEDKNFQYEFLIGLDMIKTFKLIQDENLKISQKDISYSHDSHEENEIGELSDEYENNEKEEEKEETSNKTKIEINFNEHTEEENFDIKIDHVDHNKKLEINKLIEKYKSIFAKDKYDIGTVKEYEARIDLIMDKYCSKRPYRCTMNDNKK